MADGSAAAGLWKGFIFQPTHTEKNNVLFSYPSLFAACVKLTMVGYFSEVVQ